MSVSLAERRMMEALVAELDRVMAELPECRERRPRNRAEARGERRPAPRRLANCSRLVPTAER